MYDDLMKRTPPTGGLSAPSSSSPPIWRSGMAERVGRGQDDDRLAITVTCRDRQLALQMPRRRSYNLRSHRLRSCNLHEYGRGSGAQELRSSPRSGVGIEVDGDQL